MINIPIMNHHTNHHHDYCKNNPRQFILTAVAAVFVIINIPIQSSIYTNIAMQSSIYTNTAIQSSYKSWLSSQSNFILAQLQLQCNHQYTNIAMQSSYKSWLFSQSNFILTQVAAVLTDGDTADSDAFIAQVES